MSVADSANSILKKSLTELVEKRDIAQKIVDDYNSAIIALEAIISDENVVITSDIPIALVTTVKRKKKKTSIGNRNIITENIVRDAIIGIIKNPLPSREHLPVQHRIEDGYFTAQDVAKRIGVSTTNKILVYLGKFSEKGILDSKKYKNGKIYKYVPIDGPGDAFSNQPKLHDVQIEKSISDPVARVNGKNIRVNNKNLNRMIKLASEQKCIVERKGSGHIRISNDKGYVTVSNTPSDINAENVVRRELNKIGVNV